MSKQSDAKALQGYTTVPNLCGNCAHRRFDMKLPAWMQEHNARLDAQVQKGQALTWERYYGEGSALESNQRCGLGGFAIKKTATCHQHEEIDMKK